ncbi:MAG: hypothetical protein V1820_00675 [archaeon]
MARKVELAPENYSLLLRQLSELVLSPEIEDRFGATIPGAPPSRSNFATFFHQPPANGSPEEASVAYWTEAVFGEDLPSSEKAVLGRQYYAVFSDVVAGEIYPGLSAVKEGYEAGNGVRKEVIRLRLAGQPREVGKISLEHGNVVVQIYDNGLELSRDGKFDYALLLAEVTYAIYERVQENLQASRLPYLTAQEQCK